MEHCNYTSKTWARITFIGTGCFLYLLYIATKKACVALEQCYDEKTLALAGYLSALVPLLVLIGSVLIVYTFAAKKGLVNPECTQEDYKRVSGKIENMATEWKLHLVWWFFMALFWHYIFGLEPLFIAKIFIASTLFLTLGYCLIRPRT